MYDRVCIELKKQTSPPRVLTRILKKGVKMLFARKKMEFYHAFLLALLKKLESESKSWSKIIKIWS